MNETWLGDEDSQESMKVKGYHDPIRKDRNENRGGGVALYIKYTLAVKEVKTWMWPDWKQYGLKCILEAIRF